MKQTTRPPDRTTAATTRGRLASILLPLLAAGVVTVASAPPAQATSKFGCGYPRVCLWLTAGDWGAQRWTSAYRDVTSGWQYLGPRSRGSYALYNTRNDDGALVGFADGTTDCVYPNSGLIDIPGAFDKRVDKIRIMDSATC
jgi:hypothetical protein